MLSETANKIIFAIQNNKKVSGILLNKISLEESLYLNSLYDTNNTLASLYCIAKNCLPNTCLECNSTTEFYNCTKGFRSFCSIKCSTAFNNRKYNVIKGANRTKDTELEYKEVFEKYSKIYLDSNQTIQEIAENNNLCYSAFRKYLAKNKLTKAKGISKSFVHNQKMKNQYPELFDSDYFITQQNLGKTARTVSEELGVSKNTVCVYARSQKVPFDNKYISHAEHEIRDFFKEYSIVNNTRDIITPYEIDIFIPELRIGIEYNGVYWHSEQNGKDKNYHIKKQMLAEKNNIKLIQIFDYEWYNKKTQIQGYFNSLIGKNTKIAARKTTIKTVSKAQTKEFLDANHIHGHIASSLNYGLFYNAELVSIITLGKSRFTKKYDYEVLRFCNKIGVNVIGGLSKLITYIKNSLEFNTIVSYTHRRLFNGQSFINAGFELIDKTVPGYFWANQYTSEILTRYKTQKHKLNTDLTESEYMQSKNFVKVWDCGQLVFCLYK